MSPRVLLHTELDWYINRFSRFPYELQRRPRSGKLLEVCQGPFEAAIWAGLTKSDVLIL